MTKPELSYRERLHVVTYRATLDVPREAVLFVSKLLAAERRRRRTPKGSRALTCFGEAVPVLRHYRDATSLADLAADAGIGIITPVKRLDQRQAPAVDTRAFNRLQRGLRSLGERGFALLTQRWRLLQHVKASPSRIGDIARAALVLTHLEHSRLT